MPSASDRMATVENSTLRRSPRTARRRSPSNVIMVCGLDGAGRPTVVEHERFPTEGTRTTGVYPLKKDQDDVERKDREDRKDRISRGFLCALCALCVHLTRRAVTDSGETGHWRYDIQRRTRGTRRKSRLCGFSDFCVVRRHSARRDASVPSSEPNHACRTL